MSSLGLPDHVFVTALGRDLVLFDSAADRYVALPGAMEVRAAVGLGAGPDRNALAPEAAEMLLDAGLLTRRGGSAWPTRGISKPDRALPFEAAPGRVRPADVARMAASVTHARRLMKSGLPCREFHRARLHPPVSSMPELLEVAARLRAARLLVPNPRRCLPASIVAATFLRRLCQEVDIVFGVRSYPFEAHCWIEADRIVLDDDLDRVRSFTPIAVGLL